MATVQDVIDGIEAGTDFVVNSLIIKSAGNNGCTIKWLEEYGSLASRYEMYLGLVPVTGNEDGFTVRKRTVTIQKLLDEAH